MTCTSVCHDSKIKSQTGTTLDRMKIRKTLMLIFEIYHSSISLGGNRLPCAQSLHNAPLDPEPAFLYDADRLYPLRVFP